MKFGILLVCYGNACRSVIAEHSARQSLGGCLAQLSQDCNHKADTVHALDALRSFGIDVPHHQPSDIRYIDRQSFDLIVTMDPEIHRLLCEAFPSILGSRIEEWNVEDPWDNRWRTKVVLSRSSLN